jgi:hypothetical protein
MTAYPYLYLFGALEALHSTRKTTTTPIGTAASSAR